VDDLFEGLGQALLVVHVPAERGEEGVEELEAELFFLVVAGEEDPSTSCGCATVGTNRAGLAVLVEVVCLCVARRQVNQTFDGVGRERTHRREDSGSM